MSRAIRAAVVATMLLLLTGCNAKSAGRASTEDVGQSEDVTALIDATVSECIRDAPALTEALANGDARIEICRDATLSGSFSVAEDTVIVGQPGATLLPVDGPTIIAEPGVSLELSTLRISALEGAVSSAVLARAGSSVVARDLALEAGSGVGLHAIRADSVELSDVHIDCGAGAVAGVFLDTTEDAILDTVTLSGSATFGVAANLSQLQIVALDLAGDFDAALSGEVSAVRVEESAIAGVDGGARAGVGIAMQGGSLEVERSVLSQVSGVGAYLLDASSQLSTTILYSTGRDGVVVRGGGFQATDLTVIGATGAGLRVGEGAEAAILGGLIAETLPTSVGLGQSLSDGDAIVAEDDTTETILLADSIVLFAPGRSYLNVASPSLTIDPDSSVTLCANLIATPDWECDDLDSLNCSRSALSAGPDWQCEEETDGTRCTSTASSTTPDESARVRVAYEVCDQNDALRVDDDAGVQTLTRLFEQSPSSRDAWAESDGTFRFIGGTRELSPWRCSGDSPRVCVREPLEGSLARALDQPAADLAPGWTCSQAGDARQCEYSVLAQLTIVGGPDARDIAVDLGVGIERDFQSSLPTGRPVFTVPSVSGAAEELAEAEGLIPRGILGENGPIGVPIPGECDDGIPAGECECGCIPGGCLPAREFFTDLDRDGFGADATRVVSCIRPENGVEIGGDCDDEQALVNPDAPEVWDGRDNDCNGRVDELGLLRLNRYRQVLSEFDWRHTFTTVQPPESVDDGLSISIYPTNICESESFAPSDRCELVVDPEGLRDNGMFVQLEDFVLSGLGECSGRLGEKTVSLYLIEASREFATYSNEGPLICRRIGFVHAGDPPPLPNLTPLYRIRSGFADPGKGDNYWALTQDDAADETYDFLDTGASWSAFVDPQ